MIARRARLAQLATALGVTGAVALAGASAATARPAPAYGSGYLSTPGLSDARLSGSYAASGVITAAVGIPGEAVGQRVSRSWVFVSPCGHGACPTVGLDRQRAGGVDPVFLRRTAPGLYQASGRYSAPVQCHGRTYPAGASVPYRLRVIITAASPAPDGSLLATAFTATYTGGAHIGRTRCYQPPVHDAARYTGVLAPG